MKILLVDDFEMVRVVLRGLLNDLGYNAIEEADNGKKAFEKIKAAHAAKAPFDLVFVDWAMPEMNGIELLECCRDHNEFRDLPIVMVTSESERDQVIKALKAGATDYITKPVSPNSLKKKLERIVGAQPKADSKKVS